MAEPARQLNENPKNIYDEPSGVAPSNPRPDLKALEGGGETTEPKKGHLSTVDEPAPNSENLAKAEAGGGHEDKVGKGYTGKGEHIVTRRFNLTRKKKAIGGGGIVAIVVSLVYLFSIIQGPLQFVHLSQILQRNFAGTESTSKIRAKHLFRYARTGDVGETRVGKLGSIVFNRASTQLKGIGIEFQRNSLTGAPVSMTIETEKHPDYKGLSPAEKRAAIISDYGLVDESVLSRSGNIYKVTMSPTSSEGIDFSKMMLKTSLGKLNDGKIVTGINFREMRIFYNLPRMFSPLEKFTASKQNALGEAAAYRLAEEDRVKQIRPILSPEAVLSESKLKSAINEIGGIQGALTSALITTAVMCIIRDIANDIVVVNRAAIVAPTVAQAADKIAIGSQVQSGQNFDINQLGAVAFTFTDANGKSIWQGKAMQATEGDTNPGGPDLPGQYGQAFSNKTTAENIKSAVEVKAGFLDITGALCSTAGQIVQGVLGILLIASSLLDGGASFAVVAAKEAATAAATAGAIYMLHQFATSILSDKALVPELMSGPLGGNLLAYGAREMGNIGARSMGGTELASSNTSVADADVLAAEQQDFESQGVAHRLFSINDSRSFAAKMLYQTNPNISQNVAKMGSYFLNFSHVFSAIPRQLTPIAHAAPQSYDWGFPRYGIPSSLAQDPAYQDPYENADKVAVIMNGPEAGAIHQRAINCFGVDIKRNPTDNKWDAVAVDEVNPYIEDYTGSNCDDQGSTWQSVKLYITDTRVMSAMACYDGDDEQSCTDNGLATGSGTNTTGPSGTGGAIAPGTPVGDSSTKCDSRTKDIGIYTGYKAGDPVQIRLCSLPNIACGNVECNNGYGITGADGHALVNSTVSKNYFEMVAAAKKAGVTLSANSSYRTMAHQQELWAANPDPNRVAPPGYSNHQMGYAIDFGNLPSSAGPIANNSTWDWLSKNASTYGIYNYPQEAWHWSPTGN